MPFYKSSIALSATACALLLTSASIFTNIYNPLLKPKPEISPPVEKLARVSIGTIQIRDNEATARLKK